jgi:hypothetical protein
MKFCLIKQPAGLGDIIFCQKIGVKIIEKYNTPVIWPVIEEYSDISNYIKNGIWFVNKELDFPGKNYYQNTGIIDNDEILFLPLENASHLLHKKILESKYNLINLTFKDWLNFFTFERNKSKEDFLFYNILNLKEDEEYIFVNKKFASPPNILEWDIQYPKDVKCVEMQFIKGYSIFDWCKVLENATGIYSMDTCINFFIEKLNLKTKIIEITSRRPGDWTEIDYIFNKSFTKMN